MVKWTYSGTNSKTYAVRVYESREAPGATDAGTIVGPLELSFSIYADSGPDAEKVLRQDVLSKKRQRGRVYQICPAVGNAELIRSLAVSADGTFQRFS